MPDSSAGEGVAELLAGRPEEVERLARSAPDAWVPLVEQRHNLGTVRARLGRLDAARSLTEGALERLLASFGEEHPHVELCKRSLARLESQTVKR